MRRTTRGINSQKQTRSQKKKTMQVYDNLSDSGKIESADDASLLAVPVEGTRGAREAAEELRRSAQEGAANPLRTSNSDDQGTPPRRATTDREREAFFCFFDCFWSVFAGLAYGIMQKQNSLFQRPETPVN
jgi:hypothetical protein